MKRYRIMLCCFFLILGVMVGIAGRAKVNDLDPDCVVSYEANGDYYLTIIANRDKIVDKEDFARDLIEQVRNNSFKTIRFSYEENEYPVGLKISVYLNEQDWQDRDKEPNMSVLFRQESILDGYNIVDDYDKFKLEVH